MIPKTRDELIHTARFERLFPGDGGIDVRGILACLPSGIPYALEIPGDTNKKLPALVWIYGGGGVSEYAGDPRYDRSMLAKKGVVVVSMNYRVNLFGWFAHPELTRESEHHASGDYGALDQLAAIRWVRNNIAQFGGDPDPPPPAPERSLHYDPEVAAIDDVSQWSDRISEPPGSPPSSMLSRLTHAILTPAAQKQLPIICKNR